MPAIGSEPVEFVLQAGTGFFGGTKSHELFGRDFHDVSVLWKPPVNGKSSEGRVFCGAGSCPNPDEYNGPGYPLDSSRDNI